MARRRTILIRQGLGALILLAVIGLILSVTGLIFDYITDQVVQILVSAFAALGTLFVALMTVISLQQTQRTIEDLRKDREKPVVTDVLAEVVQPAIEQLEDNTDRLESGNIGWKEGYGNELDHPLPDSDGPTAMSWFKEEYPTLYDRICPPELAENSSSDEDNSEYTKQLNRLQEATVELVNEIEKPVESKLSQVNSSLSPDSNGTAQPNVLVRLLINNRDVTQMDEHNYQSFWRDFGDEFRDLMQEEAGVNLIEFNQSKNDLLDLSKTLEDDLTKIRSDLQEEYGISTSEFTGSD